MARDDWYRNTHWDEATEAAFEAKLARTRRQKAQYLRIQGSLLKDRHPEVAIELLRRCIAEGEAFHIAHALLDTAHAYYVTGALEQALQTLEAAIDQQVREPMFRTSAAYDYAMLVTLHQDTGRYAKALAILENAGDAIFPDMVFQAEAARAIIYHSMGERHLAKRSAQRALAAREVRAGWIPGHEDVGIVPEVDDPLTLQVREIARTARH